MTSEMRARVSTRGKSGHMQSAGFKKQPLQRGLVIWWRTSTP
jgi:hypothetical protein